jgi:hypothetical protein
MAAGAVALDDEDLALGGVALLAVGELAGQVGDVHCGLAAGELARPAGGLAGGGRLDELAGDDLGHGRVGLEPAGEAVADHGGDHRCDLGADQAVLGLRAELGVRHLDREYAGEALAHVLAGELDLVALGDAAALGIGVHGAGERVAEAGKVRAPVALGDVVGEGELGLVVAVVPLQRGLDRDPVALLAEHDRRVERLLAAVEIADELLDAA